MLCSAQQREKLEQTVCDWSAAMFADSGLGRDRVVLWILSAALTVRCSVVRSCLVDPDRTVVDEQRTDWISASAV